MTCLTTLDKWSITVKLLVSGTGLRFLSLRCLRKNEPRENGQDQFH